MQKTEIEICVDCLCYLANGDVPEDRPDLPRAIRDKWRGYHLATACPENCDGWFSWSACDCCGSRLGGERHPGAAWPMAQESRQ